MERVALVAATDDVRDMLCRVADAGIVEVEHATDAPPGPAGLQLQRAKAGPEDARLSREIPDLDALAQAGRIDLVAGEAQLEQLRASEVTRGSVSAFAGWMPRDEVPALARRLAGVGASVVPLPPPPGKEPPTMLRGGRAGSSFRPVVETYATVPYADVDPTLPSAIAYVAMFGMMFADVGQGLLLVILGFLLRSGRVRRLSGVQAAWPFFVAAGSASTFFGFLFGECFGPTGIVPALWLEPLDEPITLLVAAIAVGTVLLAGAYVVGTLNRWREGGWRHALYAPTGIAGSSTFVGLLVAVAGLLIDQPWLTLTGAVLAVAGLVLAYVGLLAGAHGGAGVLQATIELFDSVLRLASNIVSFARLAAFGLVHAALGQIVWDGTTALWARGGLAVVFAVVVFVAGNLVTFTLEAVVAAVQALRLEYYELFSRVFVMEGRPFQPWHVPFDSTEEA
jgi:V/A-type H+-transporting ATPase subunit I